MPIMQDETAVTANTVSANVLSGLQHEFLDRPSIVRLFACMSATGMRCTFLISSRLVVNDVRFNIRTTPPIVPDDFVVEDRGAGRLLLTFRNTTAGTLTVYWKLEIIQ